MLNSSRNPRVRFKPVRTRITSSTYKAPYKERQLRGVGAGSYKKLAVPARKAGKPGKGHLPELAERDLFIGLEALEPYTGGKLVAPFGECDLIRVGEEISGDVQIAPVIASCQSQLRLWIGRLAASYHNRSDGESRYEARERRLPGCPESALP